MKKRRLTVDPKSLTQTNPSRPEGGGGPGGEGGRVAERESDPTERQNGASLQPELARQSDTASKAHCDYDTVRQNVTAIQSFGFVRESESREWDAERETRRRYDEAGYDDTPVPDSDLRETVQSWGGKRGRLNSS